MSGAVRMRLSLPAVIAILVLADQPARAQLQTARCIAATGIWCLMAQRLSRGTRAQEQPCQVGFGQRGGDVETLQIVVRPATRWSRRLGKTRKQAFRRLRANARIRGARSIRSVVSALRLGHAPGPRDFYVTGQG